MRISDCRGKPCIQVKVSPGADRNEIVGEMGEFLKVRIQAPPEKGKANEELRRFLAEALGLSKSDVVVIRGDTSRSKVVAFGRTSSAELAERLAGHLGRAK